MQKTWIRLPAILVVLALCATLCACGEKRDKFAGTWKLKSGNPEQMLSMPEGEEVNYETSGHLTFADNNKFDLSYHFIGKAQVQVGTILYNGTQNAKVAVRRSREELMTGTYKTSGNTVTLTITRRKITENDEDPRENTEERVVEATLEGGELLFKLDALELVYQKK